MHDFNPVDDAVEIEKATKLIRDALEQMISESERVAALPRVTAADAQDAAVAWSNLSALLAQASKGVGFLSEYSALKSSESQAWADFVAEK